MMKSRKNESVGRRAATPPRSFVVLGVTVIVGAALSGYLTLAHFVHLLGVPVALLGLLFYVLFAAVSFHAAARPGRRPAAEGYLRMLSLLGAGASVYLAVVSIAIIRAFCLFCAGLYVLNAVLLVLAFRMPGKRKGWFRIIDRDLKALATNRRALATAVIGLGFAFGSIILARQVGAGIRSSILDDTGVWLPAGAGDIGAVKGQVYGPRDAAVTVYLFSDFECPFCQKAVSTFERLMARYKNRVRFVYKHFPLHPACNPAAPKGKHENACRAARAAVCAAAENRFGEFHREVFDNGTDRTGIARTAARIGLNPDELARCTESLRSGLLVEADVKDGIRLGVRGTPAFVVGDRLLSGIRDFETLAGFIEDALTKVGPNHEDPVSAGIEHAKPRVNGPGGDNSPPGGIAADAGRRKP
jgi:protein-disulfide isomerase